MAFQESTNALCWTCAGFNWAVWLKDKALNSYILHQRFETVLKEAAAGCRLCGFIAQRYEDENYGHMYEMPGVRGSSIKEEDEQTRSYHLRCSVAIRADRDVDGTLQVTSLEIFLLRQTSEELGLAISGCSLPATTGAMTSFAADLAIANPSFSTTFGLSVPIPHWTTLQSHCAIRSFSGLCEAQSQLGTSRLNFILDQFADCCNKKGHESCQGWPDGKMLEMPTRVIDCYAIRLLETQERCSGRSNISAPYSILSHCWGTRPGLKTTEANYEDLCKSIDVTRLPASIRDAIIFTKMLGLRYIWIDSICIVQPTRGDLPENNADWKKELPNMHRYYQEAAVTLVVEAAEGDHQGFLESLDLEEQKSVLSRSRRLEVPFQLETQKCCFTLDYGDAGTTLLEGDGFFARSTPLRSRAWTLQEVVLSPRKIHISGTELVWACPSLARHCAIFRNIRPSSAQQQLLPSRSIYATRRDSSVDLAKTWESTIAQACLKLGFDPLFHRRNLRLQQWYEYVCDYRRRKLTIPSDKLPAISGVAYDMALHLNYHYYAGIWIEDAPRGLAWRTRGSGITLTAWRAPTWSWASLDCLCSLDPSLETYRKFTYQADLYSLSVSTLPMNCGTKHLIAPPAVLEVEAHVLSFKDWPKDWQIQIRTSPSPGAQWSMLENMPGTCHSGLLGRKRLQCEFDCVREDKTYSNDDLAKVMLLRLGTWVWKKELDPADTPHKIAYALMLDGRGKRRYARLGIAIVPNEVDWWEKGWKRERIILV